ncbi:hypothetical protein CDAR_218401 [Caerostris darwini]|uniref:Uncharacterized protein n=1 Tax=Caerostris darwini TaxID=1538125 RepID=A0AAV4QHJ2_9ARAC|nr:hypothetical protein CDAR_218401 [Caerostris darwini]
MLLAFAKDKEVIVELCNYESFKVYERPVRRILRTFPRIRFNPLPFYTVKNDSQNQPYHILPQSEDFQRAYPYSTDPEKEKDLKPNHPNHTNRGITKGGCRVERKGSKGRTDIRKAPHRGGPSIL